MIGKVLRVRYEILQPLAEGAVFQVFSARDRVAARDVSVRLFRTPFAQEPTFIKKVREVVARVAEVRHPNVERLIEVDEEEEGSPFLLGEASTGTSLADRMRRFAPFSPPVAVATAISILEGLQALHQAGIVHGDLGTHNIMITPEGDARLQLAGIWEAYGSSSTAGLTVLPTMAPYLAPEVSQGGMPTPASDVYAVGVLLFSLLTARNPYVADQPLALVMKHVNDPIPSPRALNGSVPTALDEIVRRALAKDPALRYHTAGSLLSDLRMAQDALRFGKSLKFTHEGAQAQQPAPAQVAPTMSAVRKAPRTSNEEEDEPADVPGWLKMIMIFLGSLVVFIVAGWIYFNLNRPRTITVPDVRRLTLGEAESRVRALGLNLRVTRRESSENLPKETIVRTEPAAGAPIYEGATLRAVVSDGSRFVQVPDVRGDTADKAKLTLETLGLKVDDRVLEERTRNVDPGTVIRQIPEPRTRVERGTSIRITVATDRRVRETAPELDRRFLYTTTVRLTGLTESVNLRVDMTDARGTRTIHESRQQPDDEVRIEAEGYGPEAIFRIYYDSQLVKQVTKRADDVETVSP